MTDDPDARGPPVSEARENLLTQALPGPSESAADGLLSDAELKPIVDEAIVRWRASNLVANIDDRLQGVTFDIVDLPGRLLGQTDGTVVSVDIDRRRLRLVHRPVAIR